MPCTPCEQKTGRGVVHKQAYATHCNSLQLTFTQLQLPKNKKESKPHQQLHHLGPPLKAPVTNCTAQLTSPWPEQHVDTAHAAPGACTS